MARPRTPLYVHALRRSERKKLETQAKRARDARLVNRARMILLSNERKKIAQIGAILDTTPETVGRWIRRYEAEGIDGLHDQPRSGGPRKADAAYETRLLELAQSDPRRVDPDCPWSVWTADRLIARMVHEAFAKVSDDTLRRALHRHRFAFVRPKLDLKHKQNPKDVKRFKRRLRAVKRGWTPILA